MVGVKKVYDLESLRCDFYSVLFEELYVFLHYAHHNIVKITNL